MADSCEYRGKLKAGIILTIWKTISLPRRTDPCKQSVYLFKQFINFGNSSFPLVKLVRGLYWEVLLTVGYTSLL
jgi:hypothetical protein